MNLKKFYTKENKHPSFLFFIQTLFPDYTYTYKWKKKKKQQWRTELLSVFVVSSTIVLNEMAIVLGNIFANSNLLKPPTYLIPFLFKVCLSKNCQSQNSIEPFHQINA